MGGSRSPEDVRHQIEAERERLAGAVGTLQAGVDDVKRRLPAIALGAAAAAIAVGGAVKLTRRLLHRGQHQ